jgi:hypothetical protein
MSSVLWLPRGWAYIKMDKSQSSKILHPGLFAMALCLEMRISAFFYLVFTVFIVLSTMMIIATTAVSAQSVGETLFTAAGVSVDATAADDLTAKKIGILGAQRRALKRILERLTLRDDYDRLPELGDDELAQVIRDFSVEGEKFGGGRYLATLTIRFKPRELRRLLQNEGISFAETVSRPAVVLPIYAVGGATLLWEDPNPWFAAWARRPSGDGLISTIVPLGDLSDVLEINAEQALRGDSTRLASIASKYGAFGAHVAMAALSISPRDGGSTLNVSLDRHGGGQSEQTKILIFTGAPGLPIDALLDDAAARLVVEIEETWKRENLLRFELEQWISVRVPLTGLPTWLAVRKRLDDVAELRKIVLTRLSINAADFDLLFVGEPEQLRVAMAQSELFLTYSAVDGAWTLKYSGSN